MFNFLRRGKSAFTLTELLIVIAILLILAGLLLPAVTKAREKGRQAYCMNNLHQISLSIILYHDDHQEALPPWLSTLYPRYLPPGREHVYICKSDTSLGADGSKPDGGSVDLIGSQYSETDDTTRGDSEHADDSARTNRTQAIAACSYMYEFCAAECGWEGWGSHIGNGSVSIADVDSNGDKKASWGEVKDYQLRHGDKSGVGSQKGGPKPYDGTVFPMVRCFHHYKERKLEVKDPDTGKTTTQGLTINIAYAGNVFQAPLYWEQYTGQ